MNKFKERRKSFLKQFLRPWLEIVFGISARKGNEKGSLINLEARALTRTLRQLAIISTWVIWDKSRL